MTARRYLKSCFDAGVAAVDPAAAVARSLGPIPGRVVVLALGKAAPAMARGAAQALGRDRLDGLVVSNHADEIPAGLDLIIGDHPVPGANSIVAGRELLARAASLGEGDTAVVLISGGGSALAELPIAGVTLADLMVTTEVLLRSGADIQTINAIRRRLSMLKSGGLAAAIAPARIVTRIVSDVVGDDPATIASGPTVGETPSDETAAGMVARLGIDEALPASVVSALGCPREDPVLTPEQDLRIVAGASVAAHAAAVAAEVLGIPAQVLDTRLTGDASTAAGEVVSRSGLGLSVFAGETTVEVTGDGIGGRNHEAALVVANLIAGDPRVWFLAAGTDGIDGTTQAAGTIVDGATLDRAAAAGLDLNLALARNDAGGFFSSLGEQIITGPTGTNVGDLWLLLRVRET